MFFATRREISSADLRVTRQGGGPASIDIGGDALGFYIMLDTPADCDALIKAGVEAKRLLAPPEPEPASPEEVAALAASIADGTPVVVANAPYHVTGAEPCCLAEDGGYICNAQDGHDGPDHVAYGGKDEECHRWPVTAGTPLLVTDHPFDAGEGSRELSGPGRELLREAIAEQDAADEGRCECSHGQDVHDEESEGHECYAPGCGCLRWRRAAPKQQPEPPRVVAGTVEPSLHERRMKALRDGSPAVQDGPYAYMDRDQ